MYCPLWLRSDKAVKPRRGILRRRNSEPNLKAVAETSNPHNEDEHISHENEHENDVDDEDGPLFMRRRQNSAATIRMSLIDRSNGRRQNDHPDSREI